MLRPLLLLSISFCCASCSRIPCTQVCYVASIVQERIDKEVQWNSCGEEVRNLLCNELTVDTAVQIALLNNPEIQAQFEEIGIARADLMQAGLFSNPLFEGYVRFPDQAGFHLNTAFSLVQCVLDLFTIPLRKKIATAELKQVQLKVANTILNLSYEVEENFYRLQAEQMRLSLLESFVALLETVSLLANEQAAQGNTNSLESQARMNEYFEAKITLFESQKEIIRLKQNLNKLFGLCSTEDCWSINCVLPTCIEEIPPLCLLEERALMESLEIAITRWEVEKIARKFGIKQWWAYTGVKLGISSEKEPEGVRCTGPAFSLELPLFNHGQADRERLWAQFRQSLDRLTALEIAVLAEVRQAQKQLALAENLVSIYQTEMLPLKSQILSTSEKYYNFMALSVFTLMNAKKKQLQTHIQYSLALRDYWIAKVKLTKALGGKAWCA